MTWSLIGHQAGVAPSGPFSSTTTSGFDTTGATLLVMGANQNTGNTNVITPSDSKVGNTWIPVVVGGLFGSGSVRTWMWYCVPASVGAAHTFTVSAGVGIFAGLVVSAWSGASITQLDQSNSNTITTNAGSITTTNSDLVVAVAGAPDGISMTAVDTGSSGFVVTDIMAFSSSVNESVAMAYLAQGAPGTVNPNWTNSAPSASNCIIAGFFPGTQPSGPSNIYFDVIFREAADLWDKAKGLWRPGKKFYFPPKPGFAM